MQSSLRNKAIIATILGSVIAIEGGYVFNPSDPGGETKYGITLKTARLYGYTGSMKDLTVSQATEIYTKQYVETPKYDKIIELTPAVGHKLIDAGVNVGTKRTSTWFQKALNSLSRDGQDYPKVVEDGFIGTSTLDSYSRFLKKRGTETGCRLILKLLDAQQGTYYMSLTNLNTFTVGWVNNRIQNVSLDKCDKYE